MEMWVDELIRSHPQSVADFQAGEEKALSFLVGAVMKRTHGKASFELVHRILRKKLLS